MPAEPGKDAHRLPAPAGINHQRGVPAGTGTVHLRQPALHPEPRLIEPGHIAGRDLVPDVLQELVQAPCRAVGQRRDRPGRTTRDAEQLRQRQRGAILGQELPGVQGVRPGHLRQRRPVMTVLPAGLCGRSASAATAVAAPACPALTLRRL